MQVNIRHRFSHANQLFNRAHSLPAVQRRRHLRGRQPSSRLHHGVTLHVRCARSDGCHAVLGPDHRAAVKSRRGRSGSLCHALKASGSIAMTGKREIGEPNIEHALRKPIRRSRSRRSWSTVLRVVGPYWHARRRRSLVVVARAFEGWLRSLRGSARPGVQSSHRTLHQGVAGRVLDFACLNLGRPSWGFHASALLRGRRSTFAATKVAAARRFDEAVWVVLPCIRSAARCRRSC